ncbi:hypothetical protein EW146_g9221 [Bondarzewia mesenterica]|uniref:Mediator of RNA polymerase II transcription subunit 25 n=1 Tax=Bondarzewia mesenterica TaxID=1095465 RepID=A0A4S4L812_9AGAM|nr:hypothetical protein EW146_g9221 [Bondarzewia mesenterica]
MLWWFIAFASLFAVVCGQQLITTTNVLGQTIVESITVDALGDPTTIILQTLAPGQITSSISATSATLATSATSAITSTASTSTTSLTTRTTSQQQGPVAQPASTTVAQGDTPYVYTTTDANGDYTSVSAIFTPAFPATQVPTYTTTGSILDYSQWLSMIGTAASGLNDPVASQGAALPRPGGAVACLVDSSLNIAAEWNRILLEYVGPVLQRLIELHPNYNFRLGFVTYGPGETYTNPVITKRFFASPQHLTKELKESPTKLGIGTTSLGGSVGMAALEGYAATIEMFDHLLNSEGLNPLHSPTGEDQQTVISYILQVAAGVPDDTRHPSWNEDPSLDSLTWDSVPAEIRKRNIHCNMILLSPIQQFTELFAKVHTGPRIPPFFTTRSQHTILLSGFPTHKAKRSSDTNAERSPTVKRSRVSNANASQSARSPANPAPHASPRNASSHPPTAIPSTSANSAAVPVAAASSIPAQVNPSPVHPAASASAPVPAPPTIQPAIPAKQDSQPELNPQLDPQQPPPGLPNPSTSSVQLPQNFMQQFMQLVERARAMDMQLEELKLSYAKAVTEKRTDDAERLKADITIKLSIANRFKQMLARMKQQVQQQQMQNAAQAQPPEQNQNQNQQQGPQNGGSNAPVAAPGFPPKATPPVPQQPPTNGAPAMSAVMQHAMGEAQAFTQILQSRMNNGGRQPGMSNAGAGQPGLQMPTHITPEMAAQMQKLMEQQRGKQQQQGTGAGAQPHAAANFLQAMPPNAVGFGAVQPQPPVNMSMKWHGTLCWTGQDSVTQEKKEVKAVVIATGTHGDLHSDTWPKELALMPTRDPVAPLKDLEDWVKRHKPALASIEAAPGVGPNAKVNLSHFLSFASLLREKNIVSTFCLLSRRSEAERSMSTQYAVASWEPPGLARAVRLLIAPLPENKLLAAVFPTTPMPELPKAKSMSQQQAAQLQQQQIMHIVNSMPEHIRNLPSDKRNNLIVQMLHRRMQALQQPPLPPIPQAQHPSQQQQQAQAQAGMMNPFIQGSQANHIANGLLNPAQVGAAVQHLLQQQQQQQHQQQQQNMMGMGMDIGTGGMGGVGGAAGGMNIGAAGGSAGGLPVTAEMLQSWMQRNEGGGTAQGQGHA